MIPHSRGIMQYQFRSHTSHRPHIGVFCSVRRRTISIQTNTAMTSTAGSSRWRDTDSNRQCPPFVLAGRGTRGFVVRGRARRFGARASAAPMQIMGRIVVGPRRDLDRCQAADANSCPQGCRLELVPIGRYAREGARQPRSLRRRPFATDCRWLPLFTFCC